MALGNIFSLLSQSGALNNTQQQSQSTGGEVVNLVESLLGGSQPTAASGQTKATSSQS